MPGTLSSGGNILYNWLIAINITPVAVAQNTTAEQQFTVPGLLLSDSVNVNFWGTSNTTPAGQTAGIGIANNRVSAANTLQIGFANTTAGSLTPQAGIYLVEIARPEVSIAQLPPNAV